MKRLRRSQKRIDTLRTEVRPRKRGRVGRYVYLTMLAGFALLLFDLLAGDLIYLRGDGMVAQNIAIVGPEYSGTVLSVDVALGDQVKQGQTVAVLRSHEMLKDLAELAAQVVSAETHLSELRIRRRKLASLIPAAQQRVETTREHRERIEGLRQSGLATMKGAASAEADAYKALEELKELEADADLVEAEFAKFQQIAQRAQRALTEIEAVYGDGVLRAAESGLVGNVMVAPGEGVKQGQSLMEVFHGPLHVLAYVPVGALYDVAPGDEVVIRFGFQTLAGQVEARQPLAYRLPQEFQRQFRTVERKQLVRVRLSDDVVPPLFTEVEVTWPGSIRAVLVDTASIFVNGMAAVRAEFASLWDRRTAFFDSPEKLQDNAAVANQPAAAHAGELVARPLQLSEDPAVPAVSMTEHGLTAFSDPTLVDQTATPAFDFSGLATGAVQPLALLPETTPTDPAALQAPRFARQQSATADGAAWRIQLFSLRSQTEAEEAWTRLQQANPDLLDSLNLHLQPAELAKGTFYRVQAGPLADRSTATQLCNSLKSRNQDCLIVAP